MTEFSRESLAAHSPLSANAAERLAAERLAAERLAAERLANESADLSWLALRYVLGELTAAETAAWESRLSVDADACLAVAQSSRLILGVQAAYSLDELPAPAESLAVCRGESGALSVPLVTTFSGTLTAGGSRPQRRSMAAVGSVLAATCALVLCLVWLRSPTAAPVVDHAAAERLVGLWRHGGRWARAAASADREPVDGGEFDVAALDVAAEGTSVPSWLLAAVSLEESGLPSADADDILEDN